jgi:molybdopterin/thiamine biosynthesis adenylyltransferase
MMAGFDLKRALEERAEPLGFSDGTPFRGLSAAAVIQLAGASGQTGGAVEIAALENGIIPARYARNFNTFSAADQMALLRSTAAVVGLGGLGGGVAEMLARTGVGHLILIDGDRFEDSNLNRQFFSRTDRLGTAKAAAAAERIAQVNPSVITSVYTEFMMEENAPRLLKGSDVVVDCLDSIAARFTLEAAAMAAGLPLVSAAVAGAAGHVTVIFPGDRGLKSVYGDMDDASEKGAETAMGCLSPGVTLLSALEVSETVKVLLKRDALLRNRLLVVDLMENLMEIMSLQPASETD